MAISLVVKTVLMSVDWILTEDSMVLLMAVKKVGVLVDEMADLTDLLSVGMSDIALVVAMAEMTDVLKADSTDSS